MSRRQLVVRPVVDDEVVLVSADPSRVKHPVTIAELADRPLVLYDAASGDRDPLRNQLAVRAQEAGLRLRPRIETETMVMALRLVVDGVGDTYLTRAHTMAAYFPEGLHVVGFDPPITETPAIVRHEHTHPSPAVDVFTEGLCDHLRRRVAASSADVPGSARPRSWSSRRDGKLRRCPPSNVSRLLGTCCRLSRCCRLVCRSRSSGFGSSATGVC